MIRMRSSHGQTGLTENIVLLECDDLPMVQMQIGSANGGSRNLQDHVFVLSDSGYVAFHHLDVVGTLPGQGLHLPSRGVLLVFILDDGSRSGAHIGLSGVG